MGIFFFFLWIISVRGHVMKNWKGRWRGFVVLQSWALLPNTQPRVQGKHS